MPRNPKAGESQSEYVSYCIKYMIDHGEYPNTKKGREEAAGQCYSRYRNRGKHEDMREKITLCASMSVANLIDKDKDTIGISDGVTMIIGDTTYNGRYFPVEELQQSIKAWEGMPIVLDHNETIENVVGHIEDVKLDAKRLRAIPYIDNYEKSHMAKTYIDEQRRLGQHANVSISAWYRPSFETINGNENTLVTRDLEPAHLAIVVHGACSPSKGCGIGLEASDSNSIARVIDELERKELVKEINDRKARLK